ncbi:GTP cyclohydrolase II [Tessaracoccus antarcticus]|uniref:GTP cyclohydrolase-2 n=1 Tax=Tessaracoccus antarcticus TaxID=2479848 RepID=A0A3M0GS93_9ACTN|nr:GTP cyclohydrolase II [Tessaracoccus antarcticus]RMB60186.1 GTP cyclohydrolase II [Tessaracoccus antarcticus]
MSLENARRDAAVTVTRVVTTRLPTRHGTFDMVGYAGLAGAEHVALVWGSHNGFTGEPPLVRVHSECLTGDAFGSYRCDCGEQLDAALGTISRATSGALVYMRGHEGRGIGLLNKLRAYALQDNGRDTVDANTDLGLPIDSRDYRQGADILRDLGIETVRLLTSNPAKQIALEALGITVVGRQRLHVPDRAENTAYLNAKRSRMEHDPVPDPQAWEQLSVGVIPDGELDPLQMELVDRYGPLVQAGERLVIAQLGQSIDGFIASRTGDACFVTGEEDREHLHRLRALVDAVIVGAGTVTADDCQLTVRSVSGAHPVRVVLDPHARIPTDAKLLSDPVAPTLWFVGPDAVVPERVADHVDIHRLESMEAFAPSRVLERLGRQGLKRVLVEGGGVTVSTFLRGGVLDRLFLTTAPMLVGDGIPGIRFDGTDALSGAITAPVRRFLLGNDICSEFTFA